MVAKIAVSAANFAIDKPYSYYVPEDMELQPGQRVQLPFGRGNRRCEGVVLSVEPGSQDEYGEWRQRVLCSHSNRGKNSKSVYTCRYG